MQGFDTFQVLAVLLFVVAAFVALLALVRRRTETSAPDRSELLALQNTWQAPPELVGLAPPRAVALTGTAKAVLGLMVLILGAGMFASVAALRAALEGTREQERLEREGVEGQAEVVRKWVERGGKSTRHYVFYSFEAGGRIYQRRASLSREAYERVRPGDRVPVRYLPAEPEVNRLSLARPPVPAWTALLIPVLFLLGPWLALRPILIQKKLLAWGQPAAAMVVRLAPAKGGKIVGYQFLDMSGNMVSGSAQVSVSKVPELRATVTVVYDPQKPSRNTLYPPFAAKIIL